MIGNHVFNRSDNTAAPRCIYCGVAEYAARFSHCLQVPATDRIAALEAENAELKAQLADRDRIEGRLVTDIADLHERVNELREAAAWLFECEDTCNYFFTGVWWMDHEEARLELVESRIKAETALRALVKE